MERCTIGFFFVCFSDHAGEGRWARESHGGRMQEEPQSIEGV